MTYMQFHYVFIFPLISLLVLFHFAKKWKPSSWFYKGLGAMMFLAVSYTTPWDNYLVYSKVWTYLPENILFTIGYVPIEEYLFFVLQTLLTTLWFHIVWHSDLVSKTDPVSSIKSGSSLVGAGIGILGALLSILLLQEPETKYLGLILVWCLPVFALQWGFGGKTLLQNGKIYMLGLLPPTLYLWVCDAIAIHIGVWDISSTFTTGIMIFNLPLEEAVFFLATNMMLIQGLLLLWNLKMNPPLATKP